MYITPADWILLPLAVFSIHWIWKHRDDVRGILPYPLTLATVSFVLFAASLIFFVIPEQSSLPVKSVLTDAVSCIRALLLGILGILLFNRSGCASILKLSSDRHDLFRNVKLTVVLLTPVLLLIYSMILFAILKTLSIESIGFDHIPAAILPREIIYMLSGIINEEMTIRLGIFGLVLSLFHNSRHKWSLAIVLSSSVWALMHPSHAQLAKYLQVFPVGLYLGWVEYRFGFETVLFSHVAANLAVVAASII